MNAVPRWHNKHLTKASQIFNDVVIQNFTFCVRIGGATGCWAHVHRSRVSIIVERFKSCGKRKRGLSPTRGAAEGCRCSTIAGLR